MSHTSTTPMMTLRQAFDLLRARIPAARLVGDGATPLMRVHTDTRTLAAGDLFVAWPRRATSTTTWACPSRCCACAPRTRRRWSSWA